MSIISPLPYTIVNGSVIDANPVMADFNQIVSNVNSNAAALNGNPGQVFQVATAAIGTEALPLAQAQADFAALNGNAGQVFQVATAAIGTEALPLAQAQADFAALNGNPGQVFQVATAAIGTEALPLAQAQADFAALNGNAGQVFNVATAAIGTEAVPLAQVANIAPFIFNYNGGTAANTTYAAPTISFTVPSNGYVTVSASFNLNALASFGDITFQIIVNGTAVALDTPATANTWNLNAVTAGTAGATMTIVVRYVVGATAISSPIFIRGFTMYLPTP
jgi:hypothetical protein